MEDKTHNLWNTYHAVMIIIRFDWFLKTNRVCTPYKSKALFTLALKPVSNRFSLNRFSQTTSIRWFTESGFQSAL